MQRLTTLVLTVFMAFQTPLCSAEPADRQKIDALFVALGLPELLGIMRIKGLSQGRVIAADMLADRDNPDWDAMVSRIYDPAFMTQEVHAGFDEELLGADLDAMLAFFTSEPGKSIVSLEISARRALLDTAIAAASKQAAARARHEQTQRFRLVARFIAENDLIDAHVAGALHARYAFQIALMEGGVLPRGVTPETALREVRSQAPEIRQMATDWLETHLLLAFQPLTDEEITLYLAFSQSRAGQEMIAALSVAFDGLYSDLARAMGLATARFLISAEL
ncbi:DUF2059 domain-containing protein [Yoonia sp.]|uniref:DUF2059 domain-containing protein n=1 Tax=Yoonia sp. TaxID=2212373 RepID=UPI003F6C804F